MIKLTKYFAALSIYYMLVACTNSPSTGQQLANTTPFIDSNPTDRENTIAAKDVWHKAKLRGVAFRAIGQEPAWLLEITEGSSILLVTDYGQSRVTYDYTKPDINQNKRITQYQLDDLTLKIEGKPCQDVMSGELFEVTVTLKAPNRELLGCGRALH